MRAEQQLRPWIFCAVVVLASVVAGCRNTNPVVFTPTPTTSEGVTGSALATLPPTLTPPATETVAPTFTAAASPTSRPTPTVTPSLTSQHEPEEVKTVRLTIAYDNNAFRGSTQSGDAELTALRTSWGFACWVDLGETTVLFDTGGDGATLMHNLLELNLDPLTIDAVVLSHAHGDHTGGLGALLSTGVKPTVYVPASFSRAFKNEVRTHTDLVEVSDPIAVAPGIHTTGEIGTGIVEQALVVETSDGLVVITGCAHPGVDRMVRLAHEQHDDQIALVVGGFHLGNASRRRVESIIADFTRLGVQQVAPCHCTGDTARGWFNDALGDDCILAGVGWSTAYPFGSSDE